MVQLVRVIIISDDCFNTLLKLRLLVAHEFSLCPGCGYTNLGMDHSFQCRKVSKMITTRHNEVKDFLASLMNYSVEKCFKVGLKEFIVDLFDEDNRIAFDITVVGGYGNSWNDAYSIAFVGKIRKYDVLIKKNLINSIIPLVFNVHGGFYSKTIPSFNQFGWSDLCPEVATMIAKGSFRCHSAFNFILSKISEARRFW
ncbi:hypothetical protein P9112_000002 [Eukaryota sp. TZLM1-RC]